MIGSRSKSFSSATPAYARFEDRNTFQSRTPMNIQEHMNEEQEPGQTQTLDKPLSKDLQEITQDKSIPPSKDSSVIKSTFDEPIASLN